MTKPFQKSNIYTATDRQGNHYCYRYMEKSNGRHDFVNLMTWKHHYFPVGEPCIVNDGDMFFEHEIEPCNLVAEYVDTVFKQPVLKV